MAEKLAEELENLNIEEPKFEKWNEFPPEIKLECIKTLDFKTKWNLRNTSHTERALVDTQKMHLYYALIDSDMSIFKSLSEEMEIKVPSEIEHISLLAYMLNHGTFDILQVGNITIHENLIALPSFERQISVKKFEIDSANDSIISFWLGCLDDKIETIDIHSACEFDKLLSIPSISHAHSIQVANLEVFGCAPQLAQMWMDKDVEVGRKFQTKVLQNDAFAQFAQNFQDKIVSATPEHVRIRTENPTKHILFELNTTRFDFMEGNEEFIRMSVIPAEMKELDTDTVEIKK